MISLILNFSVKNSVNIVKALTNIVKFLIDIGMCKELTNNKKNDKIQVICDDDYIVAYYCFKVYHYTIIN